MKDYEIICCCCGQHLDIDEVHYMADLPYCNNCLDEVTSICYECGTRIFNIDAVGGDTSRPLCERCYDDHYTNCNSCGHLVSQVEAYYEDGDHALCPNCIRNGPLYNYSYKPQPIFYGDDSNLFIGVELEMDCGGCSRENARRLTEIANASEPLIYVKEDGSLDDGFEVVTHPFTLKYHMEQMPWRDLLREALALGFLSHDCSTAGLHCHVGKRFFGNTYEEQVRNISKVLFLVEKFWEQMLTFSRRTQGQMDHWAARYGFKEHPEQVMDHAKNCGRGRYACVNLQNEHTIEFRMWRGTLKYNTLIATLQMVERLCKVAIFSSEKELQDMSWWSFICHISEPELITYLKERQLYINEPVETEEEE